MFREMNFNLCKISVNLYIYFKTGIPTTACVICWSYNTFIPFIKCWNRFQVLRCFRYIVSIENWILLNILGVVIEYFVLIIYFSWTDNNWKYMFVNLTDPDALPFLELSYNLLVFSNKPQLQPLELPIYSLSIYQDLKFFLKT